MLLTMAFVLRNRALDVHLIFVIRNIEYIKAISCGVMPPSRRR